MRDFRTLKVWEKSHKLVLEVYRATADWPDSERYGLISQVRRAAASIPSNIAEGCGRDTEAELARFLVIAMGSASELEYQLLLARDLGFLDTASHANVDERVTEVKRMLTGFIKRLRSSR